MSEQLPPGTAPASKGSDPTIHSSAAETRERAYDRARRTGINRDDARRFADQASRQAHDHLDRRG